jgi:predicted Rossmann fold nucleotide-binding protein DprA/Smf involved in DNA uptake
VLASFGVEPKQGERERSPLLDLLPASADELVRKTGRRADEVARTLVELELEGRVTGHDGVYRSTS